MRADLPHTALRLIVYLKEDLPANMWARVRLTSPRSTKNLFGQRNQAEPYISFHPLIEGCKHSFCPDRRFHPCPTGKNVSSWFSLVLTRHCQRSPFPSLLTLQIHLPASLRSTPITALQRYYECSDSCTVRFFGRQVVMNAVLTPHRSPCFTYIIFRPFCLQPPK